MNAPEGTSHHGAITDVNICRSCFLWLVQQGLSVGNDVCLHHLTFPHQVLTPGLYNLVIMLRNVLQWKNIIRSQP